MTGLIGGSITYQPEPLDLLLPGMCWCAAHGQKRVSFLTFDAKGEHVCWQEAFIGRGLRRGIACVRFHWPEYLMEGAEVALYLFITCIFASLLLYPGSPIRRSVSSTGGLRALMGLAVGVTVVGIAMSPWGKQSGGHFNPAVTLAFFRLGKMSSPDALFYVVAQFTGAIGGVCIARYVLPNRVGGEAIWYVVTAPGVRGIAIAFIGELTISYVLMSTILVASNHKELTRYTPYLVGLLYATFIILEASLSGMSMNPARSFAPALHVSRWHSLWLYFTAPTFGMLIAAELFLHVRGGIEPFCAKLHHTNSERCIFRHGTSYDLPKLSEEEH